MNKPAKEQFSNVPEDIDLNDPEVLNRWASMSEAERDQIRKDRQEQSEVNKAVWEANKGNWTAALEHAKRTGSWANLAYRVFANLKAPEPVLRQAFEHIKAHQPDALPNFLYSVVTNPHYRSGVLANKLSRDFLNDIYETALDEKTVGPKGELRSVLKELPEHPNFDNSLQHVAKFWRGYEQDVRPAHFAAMQHHIHGPGPNGYVELVDHRGDKGSSDTFDQALPHLETYAQRARKFLLEDKNRSPEATVKPRIRYINGKPHVAVYRGVSGDYADAIKRASNMDENGNVDRVLLKIPVASLSSWTTNPEMAKYFASRKIPDQTDKGVILHKWMPVEHVMHSGFHKFVPGDPVHPDEHELVFKHKTPYVKVPTSQLSYLAPGSLSDEQEEAEHRLLAVNALRHGINDWHNATYLVNKKPSFGELPYEQEKRLTSPHDVVGGVLNSPEYRKAFADASAWQVGRNKDVLESKAHVPLIKLVRQHMADAFPEFDEEGEVKPEYLKAHLDKVRKPMVTKQVTVREQPTSAQGQYQPATVSLNKYAMDFWAPQHLAKGSMQKSESGKEHLAIVAAQLGHNHHLHQSLTAAKFLAGGGDYTRKDLRRALWHADGDPDITALTIYSLPVTESNLRALKGVKGLVAVKKSVFTQDKERVAVTAATADGQDVAEAVQRAFDAGTVTKIDLNGVHSAGSLLARDAKTDKDFILKPDSPQGPEKGAKEQTATQPEREAAFYHVVSSWGIGKYYPRTELLMVNGKEKAAVQLLPPSFQSLNDVKAKNPAAPRHIFQPYLRNGLLYKWAVADWVLGNSDSHAGNLLVRMDKSSSNDDQLPNSVDLPEVALIDHGAALDGVDYDPAHDVYSFCPPYLRAWYNGNFNELPPEERLQKLPCLDTKTEEDVRQWVLGLDPLKMRAILAAYGADSAACEMRLVALQDAARKQPVDSIINRLWAGFPA